MSSGSAAGPRRFFRKPLPWIIGSLAPVISSRTVQFHYEKHHAAYIAAVNRLTRDQPDLRELDLGEVVEWSRNRKDQAALYNAAAQAWNHEFYWYSLSPQRKRPAGSLRAALLDTFGDYRKFAEAFAQAGTAHFGSGWLWLTAGSKDELRVETTHDADRPADRGTRLLLTLDLWEHAYYLDHQDRRREYLEAVIDRRLDWDFAARRFESPPSTTRSGGRAAR